MNLNPIEKQIQSQMDSIVSLSNDVALLAQLNRRIGHLPEMDDVLSMSAVMMSNYDPDNKGVYYSFMLKYNRKDSKLVHKMAQELGLKFIKSKEDYGSGLKVEATKDGETFRISGYIPATCRIEESVVDLPEDQWVKTKTVTKVICDDPEIAVPDIPLLTLDDVPF